MTEKLQTSKHIPSQSTFIPLSKVTLSQLYKQLRTLVQQQHNNTKREFSG